MQALLNASDTGALRDPLWNIEQCVRSGAIRLSSALHGSTDETKLQDGGEDAFPGGETETETETDPVPAPTPLPVHQVVSAAGPSGGGKTEMLRRVLEYWLLRGAVISSATARRQQKRR